MNCPPEYVPMRYDFQIKQHYILKKPYATHHFDTSRSHRGQEKERVGRIDTKRCVDSKGTKGNPLEITWEFIFDPTI